MGLATVRYYETKNVTNYKKIGTFKVMPKISLINIFLQAAFYTTPRKTRQKQTKEISDETSELTQNSDGFSLPPPPDEFSSYRAGIRVNGRDAIKSTGQNQIVANKDSIEDDKNPFNEVIISPMNTVGLPTVSGQKKLYTYPVDDHAQVSCVW